jgi:hypothetical protein
MYVFSNLFIQKSYLFWDIELRSLADFHGTTECYIQEGRDERASNPTIYVFLRIHVNLIIVCIYPTGGGGHAVA